MSQSFKPAHRGRPNLFFSDYQPLSVIYPWFNLMSNMFPSYVRVVKVGTSYEGREILGLRIGKGQNDDDDDGKPSGPRKTVLITGGVHAREWISVSSANYAAYTLITQYGKKSIFTNMIDSFDWIFIPVANPDGYEYTWTTDRLWRKNRQPTPIRFCQGIDLDRSFGFQFDKGTTGNPCSESYAGEEAWEAIESSQIRQWALNETASGTNFVALLDLHSYSQQVLYPYSYSCDAEPPTLENLEELAFDLVKAMYHSDHGGSYKAVAACEGNVAMNANGKPQRLPALESGGGSALDWFYEEVKVKFSYQIKLRDTGSYGFLLPKEQIVPTGREVVAAASYLGKFLLGEIGIVVQEDPKETMLKEHDAGENHTQDPVDRPSPRQHPIQVELRRRR
jgi:extracellular matrix protein 14